MRQGASPETLNRDEIYLAQTPQSFLMDVLRDALTISDDATDEAALAEQAVPAVNGRGDPQSQRSPHPKIWLSLNVAGSAAGPSLLIGNGYDLHRCGRPAADFGGVTIPSKRGSSSTRTPM